MEEELQKLRQQLREERRRREDEQQFKVPSCSCNMSVE